MTIGFTVTRLDEELSAGHSTGWAVVRHETGQPSRYVSRIFLKEQDALEHAHRLTMQEIETTRKEARLN